MQIICEYCKKPFESKNKNRRFCSGSCKNKARWADSEYRKRLKKKLKESHNKPEVLEKHKHAATKNWENEDYRNRMIETLNSDETKNKKSASMKKTLSNPDVLQKYSDSKKALWADPEYKDKQSQLIRKRWADPEYKDKQSQLIRKRWADPEYADKHIKSLYKYKDFTLPSGRVVKVQGYEPMVLEQLLREYNETDIFIGVKEINKEIGKITYIDNMKERSYYPDFYIKSTNTIIEVKSSWTYEKWKERNELKKQACLDKGFNFQFIILKNANIKCRV